MIKSADIVTDANYANLPLLRYKHNDFTIDGWSRAAIQTYWRIKELKILFDHGAHSWDFASTPNLAISHVHPDHFAGVMSYISTRHQLHMEPPRIFIPSSADQHIRDLFKVWKKMTGDPMDCDLISCKEGDEFKLIGNHYITPFSTKHSVNNQGYVILEKRQKLKPEFKDANTSEIVDIKKSGEAVSDEIIIPQICFYGDGTIGALRSNENARKSKVLICEVTFFDNPPDPKDMDRYGHIHIDDFSQLVDQLENEIIIISHVSSRYKKEQVLNIIDQKISAASKPRIILWM